MESQTMRFWAKKRNQRFFAPPNYINIKVIMRACLTKKSHQVLGLTKILNTLASSWPQNHRVIVFALKWTKEIILSEVVTSLTILPKQVVYEELYWNQRNDENYIFANKCDLKSDRTSDTTKKPITCVCFTPESNCSALCETIPNITTYRVSSCTTQASHPEMLLCRWNKSPIQKPYSSTTSKLLGMRTSSQTNHRYPP